MSISRVLVANRGEIAVRVIRACRELGLESVAAVSQADRDSVAARMADRAVCIGPPPPEESYLNIQAILAAARDTGANAVHPGYGFLAEAPELAAACAEDGVKFIGPRPETIRDMANKLQARDLVGGLGVPVVPGSKRIGTGEEAGALASDLGFPVLLKAAAGGGGRGIKMVTAPEYLPTAFGEATAEALGAFGDETLFIERYIANARHIEVQILGDASGTVVHVGERDCSLQRRYQKVVEEAPAASLPDGLIADIRQAAVTIARNIAYENAGTVEFLVDEDAERFYFLEMNTRIQVEHPVTEMITGLDLVKEQIRIADGRPLSVSQSDIRYTGHAIECRITAEAPEHGFQPRPGEITTWRPPQGGDIRVDSHCHAGHVVTPHYDSLLAKLIVKGASRWQAVARMQAALDHFLVSGVETTIPFLRLLVCQLDYVKGGVNTRWLENNLDGLRQGI